MSDLQGSSWDTFRSQTPRPDEVSPDILLTLFLQNPVSQQDQVDSILPCFLFG